MGGGEAAARDARHVDTRGARGLCLFRAGWRVGHQGVDQSFLPGVIFLKASHKGCSPSFLRVPSTWCGPTDWTARPTPAGLGSLPIMAVGTSTGFAFA